MCYAFAVPGNKTLEGKLGGFRYGGMCSGIGVAEFFYGGEATGCSYSRRIVVVRESVMQLGEKAQGKLLGVCPVIGIGLP